MARPREFDTDVAVERAQEIFWRQGFHATSMADLTKSLGLGPGSIYAAWGSKDGLYAAAVERYCAGQAGDLLERLASDLPPRDVIGGVLRDLVAMDHVDPRGCLLVNSVTERDEHEATVARAAATFRQVESAIAGAIERGIARGVISADKRPAELAAFLTTFIQGLRVMGQARTDMGELETAIGVALSVLD